MKKLKKSPKNRKPIMVFIYGPIAVGKLTVAKTLSKKLGYKLAHNHHINDFVEEVFDRGSYESHAMKDTLRYLLMENMVKAKMNIVATHCYGHNFVSRAGLTDPTYVKTLEKKLTKVGAKFFAVHLKANNEELLRRLTMNSRKRFKKLRDIKIMKEEMSKWDWQTSPKLKNNLVIDNTKLSPHKVSDIIIKHFKLK
jgi:deoxyadenosine/deoxycytidine kinase